MVPAMERCEGDALSGQDREHRGWNPCVRQHQCLQSGHVVAVSFERCALAEDIYWGLGRLAEWFKALVLKTSEGLRSPWVRIPRLPKFRGLHDKRP